MLPEVGGHRRSSSSSRVHIEPGGLRAATGDDEMRAKVPTLALMTTSRATGTTTITTRETTTSGGKDNSNYK